jgi:hypothetical protein
MTPEGPEKGMRSRGGETGGLTLRDAIQFYEARGYAGQFGAREEGQVICFSCQKRHDASSIHLDSLRRVEGASDPADMALVAALRCPSCGSWGTGTFMFGPAASPEDNEAIRKMEDIRHCLQSMGPDGLCEISPAPQHHLERAADMERTAEPEHLPPDRLPL